jgi:hypothetical protein
MDDWQGMLCCGVPLVMWLGINVVTVLVLMTRGGTPFKDD